jgi:hypothetical protein
MSNASRIFVENPLSKGHLEDRKRSERIILTWMKYPVEAVGECNWLGKISNVAAFRISGVKISNFTNTEAFS